MIRYIKEAIENNREEKARQFSKVVNKLANSYWIVSQWPEDRARYNDQLYVFYVKKDGYCDMTYTFKANPRDILITKFRAPDLDKLSKQEFKQIAEDVVKNNKKFNDFLNSKYGYEEDISAFENEDWGF